MIVSERGQSFFNIRRCGQGGDLVQGKKTNDYLIWN